MNELEMSIGDTLPVLVEQLFTDDGTAIDVTGKTITLRLKAPNGEITVHSGEIVTAAQGIVRYAWVEDEINQAGRWLRKWFISEGIETLSVPSGLDWGYPILVSA